LSLAELQVFEEEALPTVERYARVHEFELRYRPLFHVLAEPFNVLHCDSASLVAALTDLGGWAIRYASPGRAGASRSYSARVGPLPLARAFISLFEDGELVERAQADERGRASFSFDVSGPTAKACTVTLLPKPAPTANPLQDAFKLAAWLITVRLARTTDVWLRLVGRSFNEELPRIFWREKPWWTIGLGFVGAFFVDLVPVFGDASMTLYYGISAFCLEGRTDVLTEDGWIDIKSLVEERPKVNVWDGVGFSRPLDFQRIPYSGKMVEVELSNGEVLRLTPDHLVMTTQGWVPARLLRNGTAVITGIPYEGEGVLQGIGDRPSVPSWADRFGRLHNDSEVRARKKGQAESLCPLHTESWSRVALPRGHRLPEANGVLRAQARKQQKQLHNLKAPGLGGYDTRLKTRKGSAGEGDAILEGEKEAGGASAEVHRIEVEERAHHKDREVQGWKDCGKSVQALYGGGVANRGTCEVVAVRLVPFHGYVYDITTLRHAFIANGVIVHNCNTPEPYPSREKCLEYRRRTWWTFEIEAFNGRDRKRFSHDINIDRQVKLTATADDVRSEVVRPRGAET
jgi:hypothetical protein